MKVTKFNRNLLQLLEAKKHSVEFALPGHFASYKRFFLDEQNSIDFAPVESVITPDIFHGGLPEFFVHIDYQDFFKAHQQRQFSY